MTTPDKPTLRDPFPPEMVGQVPKAGTKISYVGHGAVTDRLLKVDPHWNWEPMALDGCGLPLFDRNAQGHPVGLWIKLTVNDVTRLGYGDCAPGQQYAEKVLIGDALRNAAMRFGVALDLWIKGESEDSEERATSKPPRKPPSRPRPDPDHPAATPAAPRVAGPVDELAGAFGFNVAKVLVDARALAAFEGVPAPTKPEQISDVMLKALEAEYQRQRDAEAGKVI